MKSVLKKTECMLVLSLALGTPAFAQTVDSVAVAQENFKLELSLEEAKKYALEHNRTIKNASYDVQKSEAARWKAIASMLPQVNGDATYSNMCGYQRDFSMMTGGGSNGALSAKDTSVSASNTTAAPKASSGSGKTDMPSMLNWGINVNATISGAQIVGVKVAKMAKELSSLTVGKIDQTILSNIETSYVNILAQQTTVQLLERNLENMDRMYNMTLNAVKAGVAEQNDADQISIQVAALKSGINTSKRVIEVLYNTIRTMIGVPADQEIVLTQSLEELVNPGSILSLLNSELDLNNNYDYKIKVKSTEMSEKQVSLSKSAYIPSLTAFYNYADHKYVNADDQIETMLDAFSGSPKNTVGFKLSVPIWSSGTRWADVRSAKLDYAKALNELEDTELQLGIQEKQLRYNLISAYENYENQSNNIDVMQRVFNSNTEKFKYGTISSMQLTTSSTELLNAQKTYITALMDMITAYVDLKVLLNK
ncbi:MAG: TolC family protein [Paludibacteraceae bacterium]|nr:TolC family protein [Paludibacteraceae bacterium]